ncbi:hypothetical protein GCM10010430_28020 [Kitasatospora cystarginea]|uniref:Uncharacterized protein n=1 Tax=Kitasatospora cystarginea TaxID=58350 RepID=A0ABN3DYK8_9ACTN
MQCVDQLGRCQKAGRRADGFRDQAHGPRAFRDGPHPTPSNVVQWVLTGPPFHCRGVMQKAADLGFLPASGLSDSRRDDRVRTCDPCRASGVGRRQPTVSENGPASTE